MRCKVTNVGVRGMVGHIRHDGDQHVLFLVERPRVQAVTDSHEREADIREDFLEKLPNRKAQKLSHICQNSDTGLSDGEKLIDEAKHDGESETDQPGADGRNRYCGIVMIIHDSADLRIRAIIGDQGRFKLHLVNKILMLFRIVDDRIVCCA